MENAITTVTPHPKSRTEAWAAWEAYYVSLFGAPPRKSRFNRRFWASFRRSAIFFAEPTAARPNRNEAVMNRLADGAPEAVRVVLPKYHTRATPLWALYRVRSEFPELRALQLKGIGPQGGTLPEIARPGLLAWRRELGLPPIDWE